MEAPWRDRWHAAVALFLLVASTQLGHIDGATYTLLGSATSSQQHLQWSDPQNWSPQGIPGANDDVTVSNTNAVSNCQLQVTRNITVGNLTMTSTSSRVCQLYIMAGVGMTVTGNMNYYANTLWVLGVLRVNNLEYRGSQIYGPQSQSNTQYPVRGLVQVTGNLTVRRGSYSTKYYRYIRIETLGNSLFNSEMAGNIHYCQGCMFINRGTFTTCEVRFYTTGTTPGVDSDGWRLGFINYGTIAFPMTRYSYLYYYWSMKNYGTVHVGTMRWRSTYRFYAQSSQYDWINSGTVNFYMCSAYFSSNSFRGATGTVNVFSSPAVWGSYPQTPSYSGQNAQWQAFLKDVYGDMAFVTNPGSYFWDVGRQTYISFRVTTGRTFDLGKLNTYGRVYIYWRGDYSTSTPVSGSIANGVSLSPDTEFVAYGGRSDTTISTTVLTVGGSSPSIGKLQVSGGCQLRLSSSSMVKVTDRVTVYQGSIFQLASTTRMEFYGKVYINNGGQLALLNGPATFYNTLFSSSTLNASNSAVTTQGTFIWGGGSLSGTGTGRLTTSGPAYVKHSATTLNMAGVQLDISRQPIAASGKVIAEYFQYRVATNRTQRLSSIQYWPGQSTSSSTLPSYFDNSTAIPDVARLEDNVQRPPRLYGNSPLDWRSTAYTSYDSGSPLSFTYTYATRIWFFLQVDTAGLYSFYVNNGYSIQARIWIDGMVRSPTFPYARSSSFSPNSNKPINATLAAGTVRVRLDYFVRTSSYWSTYGKSLLIMYAGPNVAKQYIPMTKVSWKRTVGGKTEFANPDASANISSSTSQMDVDNEGTIFMTRGSSLSIGSTGILNVLTDLSILGEVSASGSRTTLTNAGVLRKEGSAGVATFYLAYSGSGRQEYNEGKIEFPTGAKGVISWTNAAGGSWQDVNNWSPSRIPTASDIVLINLQGDFKVIITGTAQAESVFVGDGGTSTPNLVVSHFAKLTISDRLELHSPTLSLNGELDAANVVWTGQYITGTGKGCVFTSRNNFAMLASGFTTKYFRDIVFQNMGLFSVDVTMARGRLYCAGCKINNTPSGQILTNAMYFYWQTGSCTAASLTTAPGGSATDPCAQSGLVNSGLVTVEMYDRNAYWYYMRVYGTGGTMRAITVYWGRTYTFYIYYPYMVGGTMQTYMANVNIRYDRNPYKLQFDKIQLYGVKLWYGSRPGTLGFNTRGASAQLIQTVYQNTSVPYDISRSTSFYFYSLGGSSSTLNDVTVGETTAEGRVILYISQMYYSRIMFTKSINMSPWSSLNVQDLGSGWVQVSLAPSTTVGSLNVGQRCYCDLPGPVKFVSTYNVILRNNGTLALSDDNVQLSSLAVSTGGKLTTTGSSGVLSIADTVTTYGSVDFGAAVASVSGFWRLLGGSLAAQKLSTTGRWSIAGNSDKTFNGLTASIQQPTQLTAPQAQQKGVFVEYFQMRIRNSLNPTPTGTPSSFPPFTGFDDAATRPIMWRFEDDISHDQRSPSWAPMDYQTNGNVNTSSPYTFQYNFAVRYWTWLNVAQAGTYNFTFYSDYGISARLWLDDKVVMTAGFYSAIYSNTLSRPRTSMALTQGFHRLRLDVLQRSSSYSTRNGLLVYMSGPGLPDGRLPKNLLFVNAPPVGSRVLQYAQPAFNASLAKNNFAASISGGEIFAWNTAALTVSQQALLDIQSDVSFLCYSTVPCSLVNYGTLRRSGGFGPAQLYTTYDNKSVGVLDQRVSSITFVHPQSTTGRITWVSQTSGSWDNASNWVPQRLPRPDDVVLITVPGSYVVTIPAAYNVNVTSLLVGDSSSSVSLLVSHFTTLTVTDRLEMRGDSVTIYGSIDAGSVVWSGKTIQGSTALSNSGQLIVRKTMLVTGSLVTTKYLTTVTIMNYGTFTQDSAMYNGRLYCSSCVVRNMAGATAFLTTRYFYLTGASTADATGFRAGFENYGTLVMRPPNSYVYIYWDVKNYGRVVTMPWYYLTQPRIYAYSVWVNYGTVDIYLTNFYIYSGFKSPRSTVTQNGVLYNTANSFWNMYSRPVVYNTGSIRGNRMLTMWREWLEDVYQSGLYDGSRYCYLRFQNLRTSMYFGEVTTKGNVQIYNYYSYGSYNVSMQRLDMDPSGQLYLYRVRSSSYRTNIVLQSSYKPHRVAFVYSYYYSGLIAEGDTIFNSGVSLNYYGQLRVEPNNMAEFQQYVVSQSSSTLTIANGPARFYDQLRMYSGTFNLLGSRVTMLNIMQWGSSTITGIGGTLVVTRDSSLTSSSRQLQGVNLVIDGMTVDGTQRGFIAEYFRGVGTQRYFYDESTSSRLSSSFDNPTSTPNFYRLENYVQRPATYYGIAPKYISPGGSSFQTSTSLSFSYDYATRLTSYLKVPATDSYTFYFQSGYATRARMWIDGVVRFTSKTSLIIPSAAGETSSAVMLTAGFHLLRIDLLLASRSYLSTNGAMLSVQWSDSSLSKQDLPVSALYPFIRNASSFQAAAASLNYQEPVYDVCESNLTVSQALQRPFSYSRFRVTGSLSTTRNGRITVGQRGTLELQSSTSWPLSSTPSRISLYVGGQVIRTAGSGLLNLNTLYNISDSGCQSATSGSLELGVNDAGATAPTVSGTGTVPVPSVGTTVPPTYPPGKTVTWNGTRSGSWNDASNWNVRVPMGNDDVIIPRMSSTFTVTISADVTIRSLTVGSTSQTSYAYLSVSRGASLTVSGTARLNSYRTYVYGVMTVGRLEWSGYYLYGNNNGVLNVLSSGTIRRALYSSKYLQQIQLFNFGAFTIDSSMDTGYLYTRNSHIVNDVGATLITNGMQWRVSSASFPGNTLSTAVYDDGQPKHLTNRGNFTMVLGASSRTSTYMYWAIGNYGRMSIVNARYQSNTYVYWYSLPVRMGRFDSYFASLNFFAHASYGPTPDQALAASDIRVRGMPMLRVPFTRPRLLNIALYQTYLDAVYANATSQWDVSVTVYCRFYNIRNSVAVINRIWSEGQVAVQFTSCYSSRLSMTIAQDRQGYVSLGSNNNGANTLELSNSATTGSMDISSGWLLTMPATTVSNFIYLRGTQNCQANLNTTSGTLQRLFIAQACSLTLRSASLSVAIMDTYGTLALQDSSNLAVSDLFRWSSGILRGTTASPKPRSQIALAGYVNITGFDLKTHDTVDVVFAANAAVTTTANGVVAQYFNYLKPADNNTAVPTRLYYFPSTDGNLGAGYLPESFNSPAAPAVFQRVEASLQRPAAYFSNWYGLFTSTGGYDYTSDLSFSRLYAVRLLSYVQITAADDYVFYLRYNYGPARLWIDDKVIVTGPRSASINYDYASNATRLGAGYHKIRVDMIVGTTTHNVYGSNVLVSYSSSTLEKQLIPDSRLFVYDSSTPTPTPISPALQASGAVAQRAVVATEAILARGGAGVMIQANCQVFFSGDTFWLSTVSAGQTTSNMVLQGTLTKTGGGISTFFLGNPQSGGVLQQLDGVVNFQTPTILNSPVFWNNSAGGLWTDPGNWSPNRVPTASSIVFIDLPGAYTVVITPKLTVQVEDLIVGGVGVSAQLFVASSSRLVANDRLDLIASTFNIQGTVDAARITFGGRYLSGSVAGSGTQSTLIVRKSLSLLSTGSSSVYFQNIRIQNQGVFTIGSSSRDMTVYCQACSLVNTGTLILERASLRVTGAYPAFDSNNFRLGLQNMAGATVYWLHRSYRTQYCYWDILNRGAINNVGVGSYSYRYRVYMYGTITNFGSITLYSSTMYVYGSSSSSRSLQLGTGSFAVYGAPVWNTSISSSQPTNLSPQQYINLIYSGLSNVVTSTFWDRSGQASLYFQSFYYTSVMLSSIKAVGYARVQFSNSYYSNFTVTSSLDLGYFTSLQFYGTSRGTARFSANSVTGLGYFYNSGYWSVNLDSGNTDLQVYDFLSLRGNASVTFSSSSSTGRVSFRRDVFIPSGTAVTFSRVQVTFNRRFLNAGSVTLMNAGGVVWGEFAWSGGKLIGSSSSSSYLTLSGGCTVKGTGARTLDGINLGIKKLAQPSKNGVIAEYFKYQPGSGDEDDFGPFAGLVAANAYQYWQANSSRCTEDNNCVPASFDDLSTQADTVHLEKSLGVRQSAEYQGPVAFSSTGGIDYNNDLTFTYNYATRRLAYLSITTTGMYRFTMLAQYRIPRIWVNGDVIFTATSYSSSGFPAQQTQFVQLSAGYVTIRVDEIVRSSASGGSKVYYEGPGVPFQPVPLAKLYYRNPVTNTLVSSQWQMPLISVCALADDSLTIMANSAVLNVSTTGLLNVQTDAVWYSNDIANKPGTVVNAGLISKTGGVGVAVFLAQYRQIGQAAVHSQVKFFGQSSSTGVLFWVNPNGGLWSEASNWMPKRVPTANDYVFITEPGQYKVVVDGTGGQECKQLDVGASDADVTFTIEYFSSLTVSATLYLNTKDALLHGNLTAGTIQWAGSSITGDPHSGSSVIVTATNGFTATTTSYSTRTLQNIQLTMGGSSVWNSNIYRVYISGTNITVLAGGVLNWPVRYFGSSRSNNFQQGLINYGTVYFATSSSSSYIYDGILNYGSIYLGRSCVTSSSNFYIYSYFANMSPVSKMRFHNAYVRFYSTIVLPSNARGTIEMWGGLYWPFGNIPTNCDSTRYSQSLATYYNVTRYDERFRGSGLMWDTRSTRYMYINSLPRNTNLSSIVTRGRVEVRVYSTSRNVTFNTKLDMDSLGLLNIYSSRGNFVRFPEILNVGTMRIQSGSTLIFPDAMQMQVGAYFVVQQGVTMKFNRAVLNFNGGLSVTTRGMLNLENTQLNVDSNLYLNGGMWLKSCTVDFAHDVLWAPSATINGSDSWIYIRRRVRSSLPTASNPHPRGKRQTAASSSLPLNLGGTNMRIVLEGQVERPSQSRGVLAEYFQYRLGPDSLSSIGGFYNDSTSSNLVPESFNDPRTEPTYSRIEPSVSYAPTYGGHSPLAYSATGSGYDSNSMFTFTYNFAVRYTFFVNIPVTSSNYKISFSGPYYTTRYVRVWVNDSMPSATIRTARFPSSSSVSNISFIKGYNKLRIDVIQQSSYWDTIGNMLYVNYELPGILSKTLISNQNSYYRQSPYWTGEGSPYPAPSFQALTTPACEYTSPNTTYDLCNSVDVGVSCWQMSGGSYINSTDGPSIWVTPTGVLDVSSTTSWTYKKTRLSLLNSGVIVRDKGLPKINLETQYATSGGCSLLEAAGDDSTIDFGIAGVATFPPTTEPPPTLPPPTTPPPVQERSPTTWTSDDVQQWIATTSGGEFAPLGKFFRDLSGIELLKLSREDFIKRVQASNPELVDLAHQLYDMLDAQEKKYGTPEANTSSNSTGVAVGAAVGAAALIVILIVIVVLVRRKKGRDTGTITFNGQRSKRLSEQPVLEVENPGYMTQSTSVNADTSAMPRSSMLEQMKRQPSYDTASSEKLQLAKGEVLYDDVGNPDEQIYEDMGAEPGSYANHPSRMDQGDVYEVMG
ncbi:uncharacterized protein LOC135810029 [Sycon ciliatum]|uniref:uncharacterized protein LOC135810029 n=1 Tax=Sycon ciliatum TaxID=27933 RepID=UPI0031F66D56